MSSAVIKSKKIRIVEDSKMGKINLSDEIWGDIIRIFMDDEISLNEKMKLR